MFLQAPGISRLSPQAKLQCQMGCGAPRGLKQKGEGHMSLRRAELAVLLWGDRDIPLPPAVTHCLAKFASQSCLNHSKQAQITLCHPAAAWCIADALSSQALSGEFYLVNPCMGVPGRVPQHHDSYQKEQATLSFRISEPNVHNL